MLWIALSLILSTIVLIFLAVTLVLVRRQWQELASEHRFRELIELSYAQVSEKMAIQSKQVVAAERELIRSDLEHKHELIAKLVTDLNQVVGERQRELLQNEKERAEQFGGLSKMILDQRKLTEQLLVSTDKLATVLDNNQMRGQWGERIIEELLTAAGLQVGVHYRRQTPIAQTSLKPDITLLLPDQRLVAVDVKFPLASLQDWVASERAEVKKTHLKKFADDVKKHIAKVATYIEPEAGTLDYAVLFVPNEAVFSFINQQLPTLLDEALQKRVLLTSPFTFIIVARTIMESYRNFLLGDKLREVLTHFDAFVKEWESYQGALNKVGKSIESLGSAWTALSQTRTKQLQRKVARVVELGQASLPASETELLAAPTDEI